MKVNLMSTGDFRLTSNLNTGKINLSVRGRDPLFTTY